MKGTRVHTKRILYADNDRSYLDARAELLENAGYQVIKAYSPQEAEHVLETENVHLAVLDIRLVEDADSEDISGIALARDPRYKRLPKIFCTGFPTYEAVREAYGPMIGGESIAYAFLSKPEGSGPLIEAVSSAFENVVRIRWDLNIAWDQAGLLSFPYLALLLEPGLDPSRLESRSSELRDLFCKLFAPYEQISIDALSWVHDGCACLTLYAFEKAAVRQFILVCGAWEPMQAQHKLGQLVLSCKPAALGEAQWEESMRYAGLAYGLPSGDQGPLLAGRTFFREASERAGRLALESLFTQALYGWHQHERSEVARTDLAALYRNRLEISSRREAYEAADCAVQSLAALAASRGLLKELSLADGELQLVFANRETFRGPDPLAALFDPDTFEKQPAILSSTFGGITLKALLLDQAGQAYVTDMSPVTRSHLLEDFVALECEFRFGGMGSANLLTLRDLEKQVCESPLLAAPLPVANVEPEYRRALANVQSLRKLAAELAGEAQEPYLVALFHYALQPVLSHDPNGFLTDHQAAALVHRLMAASLILKQVRALAEKREESGTGEVPSRQLVINEATREVFVEGRPAHLTLTEFKLLAYMFHNPDRLCTRGEILAEVFEIKGTPTTSDKSLLNTHIDRLRKKIDLNPAQHRFIVTVRGEGYRLDLKC